MENLKHFFYPESVVLIGATERECAAGRTILENLLLGKDKRRIYAVNPNREKVFDLKSYPTVDALPEIPDLAIIVTRAEKVLEVVEGTAKAGVKSIIIVSSGFKEIGEVGKQREEIITSVARQYHVRIMGPNCMGVVRPANGLNTTFIKRIPKPGNVAFLSQSGALGAGILDWAMSKNMGLSAFVSLGSMLDVDFGDLIDYFGEDPETRSIIIYPESIGNARKFMSAARGFARTKPIIVLKPGRFQESITAARSHTGAMVGEDLYYDAVFRRAGVVRVEEIKDLFYCASILNTAHPPKGPNLAIIANGGGPAVLATDSLISRGGKLARLTGETIEAMNEFLPPNWSKANPVDVQEDADLPRFVKAIELTMKDPNVNGAVVIYTPQGANDPIDVARIIIEQTGKTNKPILTSFIGETEVAAARRLFYEASIPTFEFPEDAIRTYTYMYQYARNLEMLYETPEESTPQVGISANHLRSLLHKTVREGKTLLSESDAFKFLRSYGIDANTPFVARTSAEAVRLACGIGYPVVAKVSSPDISHKSDVGGVVLNICSDAAMKEAFDTISGKISCNCPGARIDGISIGKMIECHNYELIVGSKKDPIFGPVIMFGMGGIDAELFKDIAVGLPPLNQVLARRLLEQTKIADVLAHGFRSKPPVNLKLLEELLVKVSNLIVDFPEIQELDINPIAICPDRAVALDERIIIDTEAVKKDVTDHPHLIITPYPAHYIQPWRLKDGRMVMLRPVTPADEPMERGLLENLSEESSRFRFFYILKDITHDMLTRFCNIDYDREMAIVAEYSVDSTRSSVGASRLLIQPDGESAEFAVLVADNFQCQGLGLKLVDILIGIAQEKKLKSIYAIVLNENTRMLNLAKRLGFTVSSRSTEDSRITLEL